MNKLATLLSTVFHPLLMPTYGIAIALYTSYMRIFGDRLLGIYILYKLGHISDFRLHERTERTIPYLINFACYVACYLYLYRFGIPSWIIAFIAGAIVALIISLFINRYWKISAHMVAAGSMVTLVFLMSFYSLMLTPYILPLQIASVLLAGAIGSSRILLKRHTLGQVGAGFALGILCCGSMFFIFA